MKQTRVEGDTIYFDFVCPGCDAEGELGTLASEGMKPFGCPAGCGSTFVPWQPDGDKWELRCVVQLCHEERPRRRARR